jgi:hypothetical protein
MSLVSTTGLTLSGVIKLQNKVGDNKVIKLGFYGI